MKVDKRKASLFLSSLRKSSLLLNTLACAGHQWHQTFMKAPAPSAVPRTNERQIRVLHEVCWAAWARDMIQQWHCKENESSFKWLGRLWVQRQHKTTCGSVRNLRISWAVCNASVCPLLYLPAMYLHSVGILDWPDLDSQTKITVKFWMMKTFPQGKKKHVLTDKKKGIFAEKY